MLLERARQVKPLWDQVRGSRVMPGQVVDLARAHGIRRRRRPRPRIVGPAAAASGFALAL
ncbi:MAG: hypothetical protein IPH03_08455 [Tetrasphaera sp.]|nr:hypothetical protein [Tetrasphaera sp.]